MGGLRRIEDVTPRTTTHYYPEGGWGWIVCACAFLAHVTTSGAQLSAGALNIVLSSKFEGVSHVHRKSFCLTFVSRLQSPTICITLLEKKIAENEKLGTIVHSCFLFHTFLHVSPHKSYFLRPTHLFFSKRGDFFHSVELKEHNHY